MAFLKHFLQGIPTSSSHYRLGLGKRIVSSRKARPCGGVEERGGGWKESGERERDGKNKQEFTQNNSAPSMSKKGGGPEIFMQDCVYVCMFL